MKRSKVAFLSIGLLLTPFVVTSVVSCDSSSSESGKITDKDREHLISISIAEKPNKLIYYVGETFDPTGLVVTANYWKNKSEAVTNYEISGGSTAVAGDIMVVVTHREMTAFFDIHVDERAVTPTLSSVRITRMPNKTLYTINEAFDPTGLEVTANYSDGSYTVITNEITYEGFNPGTVFTAAGSKSTRVKYNGYFDVLYVYVKEESDYDDSEIGDNTQGDTFKAAISAVKENHNYVARATTTLSTDVNTTTYTNINDKAYYSTADDDSGLSYGIILQKNQGYVRFRQSTSNYRMTVSSFIATNTSIGISEFYVPTLEAMFESKWTQNTENLSRFYSTDFYAISIGTNFTGYSESAYLEAPEQVEVVINSSSSFQVVVDFAVSYVDPDSGDYVKLDGQTLINVSLGTASNQVLESYIANPSYVYTDPTNWSDYEQQGFEAIFGKVAPMPNLTYSYWVDEDYDYRGTYVLLTDMTSGDIRESYRSQLVEAGYHRVNDNYYLLQEEDGMVIYNYQVHMTYHAPNEAYGDTGYTYGHFFPMGYMEFEYLRTSSSSVTNVSRYNDFIATNVEGNYVPQVPFGDEVSKVSNFKFSTNTTDYIFYQSAATKFHIADYNKALQDMNAYISLLISYGYTHVVYNSVMNVYNYFKPDKQNPKLDSMSYISITALDKIDSLNYSGVFEIRCQLYRVDF